MANYFDSSRDRQIIADGGFLCASCLIGKPASDQSDNPRYCHGCFKYLLCEAELLPENRSLPSGVPVPVGDLNANQQTPTLVSGVTKVCNYTKTPPRIMLQRGRPRKEGEVTRMTKYRRGKKNKQGVLGL